jgi:transcriptional regulator GlxA family with amidase domain
LTPSGPPDDHREVTERLVAIVVFPGHQVLDLAGPHEVFHGANRWLDETRPEDGRYRVEIVGTTASGLVASESGLAIATTRSIAGDLPGPVDTLIVVGGTGVHAARRQATAVSWLAWHGRRARRVASVCSGTFLLAAAGLVTTETVTTHWARAGRLQREFPDLDVQPDPLYVRSGRVWTSAGVTAGIDLALALVEADHGSAAAQTVARWLVMFLRRPGGQSQFSAPVWTEAPERDAIVAACHRIQADPGADHSVAALAELAAMSTRHFSRVFSDEIGTSPGRYVERVRLAEARRLLETTSSTTDAVARRCGFGTSESLRRAFLRHLGVPPSAYRSRFAACEPAPN